MRRRPKSADKDREALLERAQARGGRDRRQGQDRRRGADRAPHAAWPRTRSPPKSAPRSSSCAPPPPTPRPRPPRRLIAERHDAGDRREARRPGDQESLTLSQLRAALEHRHYCWCWPPGWLTPSSACSARLAVGFAAEVAEADDAAQPFLARRSPAGGGPAPRSSCSRRPRHRRRSRAQMMSSVISSRTGVSGPWPLATPRTAMSRSVIMPISRSPRSPGSSRHRRSA